MPSFSVVASLVSSELQAEVPLTPSASNRRSSGLPEVTSQMRLVVPSDTTTQRPLGLTKAWPRMFEMTRECSGRNDDASHILTSPTPSPSFCKPPTPMIHRPSGEVRTLSPPCSRDSLAMGLGRRRNKAARRSRWRRSMLASPSECLSTSVNQSAAVAGSFSSIARRPFAVWVWIRRR